jgi:hypothetical protein
MRGGNMYSVMGGDPLLGSAGAVVGGVANLPYDPVTGGVSAVDYGMPSKTGGRRRRTGKKSRKGGRKSRASRASRKGRKTMRGGASMIGSANSGASFAGKGIAGMADYGGYASNVNGGGGPTQGGDGVYNV